MKLERELRLAPNPAEETKEEKNLKSVDIIEPPKEKLSEDVYLYQIKDGGAGVFKSGAHNYERERAAFLVNKFLGFDLVPVTVIRTIGGKEGSFQRFIADGQKGNRVSRESVAREEKTKAAIFDFLINVVDRVTNSFLVKEGRIFAIDNECSFPTDHFFNRPVYFGENFFSASVPQEIRNKIIQFDKRPEERNLLRKSLKGLLNKKETEAFLKRLEYLTQYARRGYFQTEEEYEELKGQYEGESEEEIKIRKIEREMGVTR